MTQGELVLCELSDAGLPRLESYAPFCLKVHRALQLCGLSYQRRHGSRPAAFKRLHPSRQVPLLLVDGEALADSTAIVSYLDLASGNVLSRHLDGESRARAFLLEEMADDTLSGYVEAARWIDDDNWPRTRAKYFGDGPRLVRAVVAERVRSRMRRLLWSRDAIRPDLDTCWRRLADSLDYLEASAPSDGYWFGEYPSRADIALFAQLWSLKTPLTPRQADLVDARPKLSAWLLRVDDACALATGKSQPEQKPWRIEPAPLMSAAWG